MDKVICSMQVVRHHGEMALDIAKFVEFFLKQKTSYKRFEKILFEGIDEGIETCPDCEDYEELFGDLELTQKEKEVTKGYTMIRDEKEYWSDHLDYTETPYGTKPLEVGIGLEDFYKYALEKNADGIKVILDGYGGFHLIAIKGNPSLQNIANFFFTDNEGDTSDVELVIDDNGFICDKDDL